MRRNWMHAGGSSVIEFTAGLTLSTLLTTMAAPTVHDYLDDAKLTKAWSDVSIISVTLLRLSNDVGSSLQRGPSPPVLLITAGEVPLAADSLATGWATAGAGVAALDDYLVTNVAGYARPAEGQRRGWRGPYLQKPLGDDPWGHRYAVNIAANREPHAEVLVLSAGPDGTVAVPFIAQGISAIGDDIIALLD